MFRYICNWQIIHNYNNFSMKFKFKENVNDEYLSAGPYVFLLVPKRRFNKGVTPWVFSLINIGNP